MQRSSELLEHARHPSMLGGGIGGDFLRSGRGDFGHSLRELGMRESGRGDGMRSGHVWPESG
jgi:hypothetical protein